MQIQPDDIKTWGGISALFGAIGGFFYKVRQHGRDINALQAAVAAIPKDISSRLYKDNLPIYRSADACQLCQKECRERFDARISSMDAKLDKIIDLHMKKD